MLRVAPLHYDVAFKKAFCDVEVFKAFVFDIAGVQLEIDRVETEKAFHPPVGYVRPRFDLFAEDVKNRVIVDIQNSHFHDHYDRFLYYHCVALLEQIKQFGNYKPRLTVYTIAVLTSGESRDSEPVAVADFDPADLDGRKLGKLKHKIIYLAPHRVKETTPEPYREWLLAIKDSLDGQVDETVYTKEAIQRAFAHIEEDLLTPEDRAEMIEENLWRGKFRDIARRMLAKGMDAPLVAEMLELSEDDVRRVE